MIAPKGLRPIHYEDIERQLLQIFKSILFNPIVSIVKDVSAQLTSKRSMYNAPEDDLRRALSSGLIQYVQGIFSGQFTSQTSRALMQLGASWNKREKVFRMDQGSVPAWVKAASVKYQASATAAHKAIVRQLDEIEDNIQDALDKNKVKSGPLVDRVAADFRDVAKALEIKPTITPESKELLAEDYTNNMELWIKKWAEEEIVELRGRVEKNAMEGYRFDKLIEVIQQRYGVSRSKAQFLARQETALFVSKFNEQRMKEGGVNAYRWSSSRDDRVRDSHKDLDGTVQFFDAPPVVDPRSGRRGNPGEDFGCRCVPIPILNLPVAKTA